MITQKCLMCFAILVSKIFILCSDQELRRRYISFLRADCQRKRQRMLNAMLSGLFIRVFQRYEDDMEVSYEQSGYKNSDIIAILRYMQDNFKEIKMQDLASAYGYSTRQLQRIISKATGQSFHEIIQTQKLRFAEDMLLRTDYSVQTVAEESGFPSVNNFRKQFKKHFGVMPNEFRMRELQVLAEH